MGSAAPTMKAALLTGLTALYGTSPLVVYGPPGVYRPDEIVSLGEIQSTSDVATLGTAHKREETLEMQIIVSVSAMGDYTIQQATEERAYAILAQLETYLQTTNPTITGTVRATAGVVAHDLTETVVDGGYTAHLTATIRCQARI